MSRFAPASPRPPSPTQNSRAYSINGIVPSFTRSLSATLPIGVSGNNSPQNRPSTSIQTSLANTLDIGPHRPKLMVERGSQQQQQQHGRGTSLGIGLAVQPLTPTSPKSPISPNYRRTSSPAIPSSNNNNNASKNIKVCIRIRPPLPRERESADYQCVTRVDSNKQGISISDQWPETDNNPSSVVMGVHSFTFDRVYPENSTQEEVYAETGKEAVTSVLQGYNATVFAYGQTGTGKTFTMEGYDQAPYHGMIPRAVLDLFTLIATSTTKSTHFLVRASYLQIYQENLYDLLMPSATSLSIREDKKRGVFVGGLSEWVVRSANEVMQLMKTGSASRATQATRMNETSSRSHAIFVLIVEQTTKEEENPTRARQRKARTFSVVPSNTVNAAQTFKVGKLTLVDLAGSERVRDSGASGQRFEESKAINASLSALGNVIASLSSKKQHIPYRDSKLTRILEASLGGNTKTSMLCMISPSLDAYGESLSTLQFASRAKKIENSVTVNEDLDSRSLLRKYEKELKRLREELESREKTVFDKRHLIEIEEQRKRAEEAEEDKQTALLELETLSLSLQQEKKKQKKLIAKIAEMNSQLLTGQLDLSNASEDELLTMPAIRSVLMVEEEKIRKEYERRWEEVEKEKESIGEEKEKVAKYRILVTKQREMLMMIQAKLKEKEEKIVELENEVEFNKEQLQHYEDEIDSERHKLIKYKQRMKRQDLDDIEEEEEQQRTQLDKEEEEEEEEKGGKKKKSNDQLFSIQEHERGSESESDENETMQVIVTPYNHPDTAHPIAPSPTVSTSSSSSSHSRPHRRCPSHGGVDCSAHQHSLYEQKIQELVDQVEVLQREAMEDRNTAMSTEEKRIRLEYIAYQKRTEEETGKLTDQLNELSVQHQEQEQQHQQQLKILKEKHQAQLAEISSRPTPEPELISRLNQYQQDNQSLQVLLETKALKLVTSIVHSIGKEEESERMKDRILLLQRLMEATVKSMKKNNKTTDSTTVSTEEVALLDEEKREEVKESHNSQELPSPSRRRTDTLDKKKISAPSKRLTSSDLLLSSSSTFIPPSQFNLSQLPIIGLSLSSPPSSSPPSFENNSIDSTSTVRNSSVNGLNGNLYSIQEQLNKRKEELHRLSNRIQ